MICYKNIVFPHFLLTGRSPQRTKTFKSPQTRAILLVASVSIFLLLPVPNSFFNIYDPHPQEICFSSCRTFWGFCIRLSKNIRIFG